MNDYLTASNSNSRHVLDTTLDRLKGATIKGNNLVLTLEPARPAGRARGRSAAHCGAAVALEPDDRPGARDGLVADLRPEPGRGQLRPRRPATARRLQRRRRRS